MSKMMAFDQEAREAMRRGVAKLARAVKVTLGPKGRNVILQTSFGSPTVTKDGVTVAKEIDLEDAYENMGARMVREVASKTSDVAGDGTTTATVLAEAIFNEGLRAVVSGVNPVQLKQGIEKAIEDVTAKLKGMSIAIKTKKEMAQVGTIAANNDSQIGEILSDAMEKVGKDGVITVDEGKSLQTETEWVEGMQFDRGYLSPYFVTDPTTMEAVLEDCYVLDPREENRQRQGFCADSGSRGQRGQAAVDRSRRYRRGSPGHTGDQQSPQDVFVLCGEGPRIRRSSQGDAGGSCRSDRRHCGVRRPGDQIREPPVTDLGRAKKVIVDKDNTTIIEGGGKSSDIKGRIDQIRKEIENTTSDYDKEKLEERLAKLSGGVAKINVGAATESEMKEKKARVEDALHATRAAVEEGILPGGGVALLRASAEVKPSGLSHDQEIGYNIVLRACRAPLTAIASNAGQDGGIVCEKVAEGKGNFGYNAATDEYEDLVKAASSTRRK
jgi:chaperonin GroEL